MIKLPNVKDHLTIDPGLHTGWAYWDRATYKQRRPTTGVFSLPRAVGKSDPEEKIAYMADHLDKMLEEFAERVERVILEGVELWGGSAKSYMSGTSGDLFLLAYLVGAYMEVCRRHELPVYLVTAREWKGSMKNDVQLVSRIGMATGLEYPNVHIRCAVGIGLAVTGEL